jgi:GNAT superfamily N-acetyltransferase
MDLSDPLEFESSDRRRIYEYVETAGAARPEEIWEAVSISPEEFNHEVAVLKRDGYVTEDEEGRLRLAMDEGVVEEFDDGEVAYEIRPARQSDFGGVVGAIREVTSTREDIVAESVAELLDHEDALLRHNEVETRMFFVATVDDDVVGWAHVETPELEKLRHTAELTVGVLEEYRGHGMGGHLLERGLEWAAAGGLAKAYVSLPATNTDGVSFLLERGWRIEAARQDHYYTADGLVDEVMLAREL